jgi:hypothetical protein
MFVCFGFDDNGYADGIKWFRELVEERQNADGTPVRATFFNTGSYGETFPEVLAEWRLLVQDGHEIGNHTWSHPHGRPLTLQEWQDEITGTTDFLKQEVGVSEVYGFRTPFLEATQTTFNALTSLNMYYDCTIEAGYGTGWEGDGTNGVWWWSMANEETRKMLFWPYTLDNGPSPPTAPASQATGISCPGMWEIHVYTYLRESGGELAGFDFNLWNAMDKSEFVSTLKYNFDLQFSGNRCPITINAHTDYYSEFNEAANTEFTLADYTERRQAIEEFLDYVLSFPEVRVVPYIKLIEWMNDPVPLGQTSMADKSISFSNADEFLIKTATTKMIEFTPLESGFYSFSIFNAQAETVRQINWPNISNKISFDPPLPAGAYVIRLSDDRNSIIRKAVLVK